MVSSLAEVVWIALKLKAPEVIGEVEKPFSIRVLGSASPKMCSGMIGILRAEIKS